MSACSGNEPICSSSRILSETPGNIQACNVTNDCLCATHVSVKVTLNVDCLPACLQQPVFILVVVIVVVLYLLLLFNRHRSSTIKSYSI